MKKIFIIAAILLPAVLALKAQQDTRFPLRTPECEAQKGVEQMRRDLSLTDNQLDTVYRIHLKYALLRRQTTTRAEMIEQLNQMTEDFRRVLTPEQFTVFMNQTVRTPHRPVNSVRRIKQEDEEKDSAILVIP